MGKKSTRQNLTRDDWLAAAIDALEESGVDGVKVLPLAKRLGASRGSFYWHFRDRQELLGCLLDYWDRWSTDSVISLLSEAKDRPPAERLWLLIETVLELARASHDPAIRAWAQHDEEAARVVRRVDGKRLRTVKRLFREVGFDEQEAAARGRLLAVYLMGESHVLPREPATKRRALARRRWEILVDGA